MVVERVHGSGVALDGVGDGGTGAAGGEGPEGMGGGSLSIILNIISDSRDRWNKSIRLRYLSIYR